MAAMDTLSAPSAQAGSQGVSTPGNGSLLVSLASLDQIGMRVTLEHLSDAFHGETVLVATPDGAPEAVDERLRIIPYTPAVTSRDSWVLTAPDFFNAYKMAHEHGAQTLLLLGAESDSLAPETLRELAAAARGGADLASPGYVFGSRDALVNSAILYPVTRALFGARARYPLALDMGMSLRMAERMATVAQRYTTVNQMDAILWPAAEAAAAGFQMVEIPGVKRTLPHPGASDLNAILARVAGSLFAEVDAKAAIWQRVRATPGTRSIPLGTAAREEQPADVAPMIETFRIAYTNLQEIWSLVLPPNSLLGLKRLSTASTAGFRMPDALWARIVFDFILAFRLRTLNRGHLLGALTPLYLAWVASHLAQATDAVTAERHIEALATAFEADKPYLVSRWRWPDRFNP